MNAAEESLIAYRKHDAARAAETRYDIGIIASMASGVAAIFIFQFWVPILLGLLAIFCVVKSIRTSDRVNALEADLPEHHRKPEYQVRDLYFEVMQPIALAVKDGEAVARREYREPVFVDVYNPPKPVAQRSHREVCEDMLNAQLMVKKQVAWRDRVTHQDIWLNKSMRRDLEDYLEKKLC